MLCEGKESRGWATDVAAQPGRKAIILYHIAVQCMGQPVLSQPLQVRQSAFSLIRKDKKIIELFTSSEVWFYGLRT